LHVVVANGLEPLADELAGLLATPLPDPFQSEVVAVPGAGVRTWLVARLAERLGATAPAARDGVVANVRFVYPAELVHRALTPAALAPAGGGESPRAGRWSVGPLTWAILELLRTEPELAPSGATIDGLRARAIADLFDRYALRRPGMVHAWERGLDVDVTGAELREAVRWQPRLWRRLREHLGAPSSTTEMALAATELRLGRLEPDLPARVVLVGLASLPAPHLDVLTALAAQREVHVLAPAPSLALWERIAAVADELDDRPVARADDPSSSLAAHPLTAGWGRASREALLLLAACARRAGARVEVVGRAGAPTELADDAPLLARLQHQVAHDLTPPGPPRAGTSDLRPRLDPADRSVQWHRCHGAARQVEVLRDVVVRLLEEQVDGQPRFEPRDIVVMSPDVATFAPLVEAAFAGDPDHGVPPVPVRVADRSLTADTPLLDAVDALLALLDGRFRASEVLAFASRPAVRACLGITGEHLARFEDWIGITNVRWGLDSGSLAAFDVPPEASRNTWRSGLDQVLLGVTLPDDGPELALGDTVPCDGVEGADVEAAGMLAELVHRLGSAHERLTGQHSVASWCAALAEVARTLCAVADDDAWQWRGLDQALDELHDDAALVGAADRLVLPWTELAALTRAALGRRAGRPRFGTGAVTLTSTTALRGVPHRVVCWLGLDGELAASSSADDLTATPPCVGDRDPRSELRAELLDAVLAAGERLVICTTGRDLHTNAPVAPSVPIAELLDVIDATVRGVDPTGQGRRASELIAIDHPRHAWSEPNFVAGALGADPAWSFDAGARDAADARRSQQVPPSPLTLELSPEPIVEITVDELVRSLTEPLRSFAQHRLGVTLPDDAGPVSDLPPLALDSLERWQLAQSLLAARLAAGRAWDDEAHDAWVQVQRAAGRVPPMAFSMAELDRVTTLVDGLLDAAGRLGIHLTGPARSELVEIEVGGCHLTGELTGLVGERLVTLTPSQLGPRHQLEAWVRAAVLQVAHPNEAWRAVAFGRGKKDAVAWVSVQPRSADDALAALTTALDLASRARRSVIPASAKLTYELARGGRPDDVWRPSGNRRGEAHRPEASFLLGEADLDDLLAVPARPDEHGEEWGDAPSRLERWAHRLWTAVERTAIVDDEGVG
jgi:exodeoxyribonuclease V gamma subunit